MDIRMYYNEAIRPKAIRLYGEGYKAIWLCSHMDIRMYYYEAIRPKAIRLYEHIAKL